VLGWVWGFVGGGVGVGGVGVWVFGGGGGLVGLCLSVVLGGGWGGGLGLRGCFGVRGGVWDGLWCLRVRGGMERWCVIWVCGCGGECFVGGGGLFGLGGVGGVLFLFVVVWGLFVV